MVLPSISQKCSQTYLRACASWGKNQRKFWISSAFSLSSITHQGNQLLSYFTHKTTVSRVFEPIVCKLRIVAVWAIYDQWSCRYAILRQPKVKVQTWPLRMLSSLAIASLLVMVVFKVLTSPWQSIICWLTTTRKNFSTNKFLSRSTMTLPLWRCGFLFIIM